MINAWSLLYDELYGDDEMTYPVDNNELNGDIEIKLEGADQGVVNIPTGSESDDILTIDAGDALKFDDYPTAFTAFADNDDSIAHHIEVPTGDFVNFDLGVGNTAYSDTLNINVPDPDYFASMDGVELPTPGIEDKTIRKYKEDESIKALQDYISTTYGGHYTSEQNNVQTLDLIESVGDAEAFCRSNAIKYLSRYDKKGQAKRDILKALHYSLLLYHFSGQLNETPTRGYETF